jgi:hypothetical protein
VPDKWPASWKAPQKLFPKGSSTCSEKDSDLKKEAISRMGKSTEFPVSDVEIGSSIPNPFLYLHTQIKDGYLNFSGDSCM